MKNWLRNFFGDTAFVLFAISTILITAGATLLWSWAAGLVALVMLFALSLLWTKEESFATIPSRLAELCKGDNPSNIRMKPPPTRGLSVPPGS